MHRRLGVEIPERYSCLVLSDYGRWNLAPGDFAENAARRLVRH